MNTKLTQNLSWGERFALIDAYTPTDDQITAAFGLSQDELNTARTLRASGTFAASSQIDTSKYAGVFAAGNSIQPSTTTSAIKTKGTATVHTKPETATKKTAQPKVPQKRGRKGNKIVSALQSVPTAPVPVADFIKQYGVSLAVLRQSKRFIEALDPTVAQTIGKVNVKQDKATKQLMIWRESV